MTRWIEQPLRPQGQAWPGLNTRGGRLDPGSGQLADGSFNQIVNRSDILAKRKGFVRGLDERFSGPVCGLFRYTDECGVEYLVVADQEGINVRMPFDIPSFLGSDSIPFDDFEEPLDSTRWSNTSIYATVFGSLVRSGGPSHADEFVRESELLQWFKESATESYFVEIQYSMVAQTTSQVASVVTKKISDTYLQANVISTSTEHKASLEVVTGGARTLLAESALGGGSLADGFLRLAYDALTRNVVARVIPSGGSQVSLSATLTEIQAANLGNNSAIGLAREDGSNNPEIQQVFGGLA